MTEAVLKTPVRKVALVNALENNCPYGLEYFCDGSVNWGELKGKRPVVKGACVYLKDGKCTNKKCKVY